MMAKQKRPQKIYIGSDHNGFFVKKNLVSYLLGSGYEVNDMGPRRMNKLDDYPDYAQKVCKKVVKNKAVGILICGSGQGMEIAANKIRGIYAANCWNERTARLAKEHVGANVLCLPGWIVDGRVARRIVSAWLNAKTATERRFIRRRNKIKRLER